MKSIKQWLSILATDAILIFSAYYWQADNVDGAGNVFKFIIWFFITTKMAIAFAADRAWFEKNRVAPGIQMHSSASRLLIIGFLAWIGYFWTAGFYTLASALYEAAHHKDLKAEVKQ